MRVEHLECRRFLSVHYNFDDQGGLVVTGTDRPDDITISISHDSAGSSTIIETQLKNGPRRTYLQGLPTKVVFDGGSGSDRLSVVQTFWGAPVTVRGGDGD